MIWSRLLWSIAAGGLTLAAPGQNGSRTAPLPSDPLEMATGQMWPVGPPANRDAIVQLLGRAREIAMPCEARARATISRSLLR